MNQTPGNSFLTIQSGPQAGRAYPLQMGVNQIGSEFNNQVVINDPFVADNHAQVNVVQEGCWIADLGSTHGTFVNGVRITESVWLRHNDIIQLGNYIRIRFENPQAVQTAPMRPPPQRKSRPSCLMTCVVLLLVSCCCIALLGGVGYYLYQTGDLDPQSLFVRFGLGEVQIANLTEETLEAELFQLDAETGQYQRYDTRILGAYDLASIGSILPGTYEMRFTFSSGNAVDGSCWMQIKSGQVYQFAAVRQGVAVTLDGYQPDDPDEIDILTSSLCRP